MEIDEIERAVKEIRAKPLRLVCMMPTGRICTATVRECWAAKARFLHVANDELDVLLGMVLGGDNERV